MNYGTKHLAISIARVESGLSEAAWRRFVAATGLTIYRLPGNGRVVNIDELNECIARTREPLSAIEAISRD